MKKLLLLVLLSVMGTSTFAASNCSITYNADDKLTAIIKENKFEFDNYDAVCQRLKSANAAIKFTYNTGTSDRETTSVVIATVKDKNLPIESNWYNPSMWSNPEQSSSVEKDLLIAAVNKALSKINQKDIDGLNENRKKLGFQTYPASTNTKSNKK
ncbi:hypothetical protein KTH06_02935 [Acinetobacter ursingii]|uniref:hypothetical protein n=1 Tax=Acinetobacter ursingii TaxID=108980 RepID=UPI00124FD573|nr:hypothetical protein [Acinetobacter ursingii]MCU4304789.1 hypothetical protein [Acinetobacter ursingii]MCU4370794.1 hypothetical protein [Acinetobacter ursingii]MDG9991754.1 hypothetical protein [Acinetobacter ursingii]MDH0205353.1 hypothetical protein [Acinetobacter ursingii]